MKKSRKPYNQSRNQRILERFQTTGSTRQVADELGFSISTVRYTLKKLNALPPRVGRIQKPYTAAARNAELLLRMNEEGCSLAEMARAVGTVGREIKKFLRRKGVTRDFPTAFSGARHYAWKGRLVDKDGYILIHSKGHPNARKHTHYVFEHRLVMEEMIGRFLLPDEVVHHRDGDKQNNAPENLQLFSSNGEHLAFDLQGRCPHWSPEGKERIRKATLRRWQTQQISTLPESTTDAPPCSQRSPQMTNENETEVPGL